MGLPDIKYFTFKTMKKTILLFLLLSFTGIAQQATTAKQDSLISAEKRTRLAVLSSTNVAGSITNTPTVKLFRQGTLDSILVALYRGLGVESQPYNSAYYISNYLPPIVGAIQTNSVIGVNNFPTGFNINNSPTVTVGNTLTVNTHSISNASFSVAGTPTVHTDNTSYSISGTPTVAINNLSFAINGTPTFVTKNNTQDSLYLRMITNNKGIDSLRNEIRATNVKLGQIKQNLDSLVNSVKYQEITFTVAITNTANVSYTLGGCIATSSTATTAATSVSIGNGTGAWEIVGIQIISNNEVNVPKIMLVVFSSSVTMAANNTNFTFSNFGGYQGMIAAQQGFTNITSDLPSESFLNTSGTLTAGNLPMYISPNVSTLYFAPICQVAFTGTALSSFKFKIKMKRLY